MPYDDLLITPMREELTKNGFQSLEKPQDVDKFMSDKSGTALLVINSVCGCAAGSARPGVLMALQNSEQKPKRLATVFAGQETDATAKARSYFPEVPPSSPSMALLKDGKVVHFVPRHQLEGRDPQTIANDLQQAFQKYC